MRVASLLSIAIFVLGFLAAAPAQTLGTEPTIPAFRLPNLDEQPIEIGPTDDIKLTVVTFLGTECPLAKLYAHRLNAMSENLKERGVRFIGINSNRQDSLGELRESAQSLEIAFPLLKDYQNKVADQFDAIRTPEVFVLDADFVVRYRGRIDNQYEPGISRAAATEHELKNALNELLDGQVVSIARTEPEGCFIGRVREPSAESEELADAVTYCKQVATILQTHCVECHRSGEIGPFVLDDYDEVAGWADTILEVIDDGRMPPWHANPAHGDFVNARQMSESDKKTLRDWVAAGTPYGDAANLPPKKQYTEGWRLPREPDLIVEMGDTPFTVPAEGTVDYQYFVVDPGFTEDKWVVGAEVIPGDHSVVHHSIVFVRPPDGSDFRGFGWVAAYVPGQEAAIYPPGMGQRVPAGSKFVFQQHYTPTGNQSADKTRIGLLFGDDADITQETYTIISIDQEFEIPPGKADFTVKPKVRWIPEDGKLLSISPHMHLRGKSFRLRMRKDDKSQLLLDVPGYDFNWQHAYQLREPIPLADIDGLDCEFVFDNSSDNPVNPDPGGYVMWGDQTDEEMAVAFFQVSRPRIDEEEAGKDGKHEEDKEAKKEVVKDRRKRNQPTPPTAEVQQRMSAAADDMLREFDANHDGEVSKSETPWVFRRYQFRYIDKDRNAILTRKEIETAARRRVQ